MEASLTGFPSWRLQSLANIPRAAPGWAYPAQIFRSGAILRRQASIGGSPASKDRLKSRGLSKFQANGLRQMDDPNRPATARPRRLILVAILALGVVIGGIAYRFSDTLTEFAQSVTAGKLQRAQSRAHY